MSNNSLPLVSIITPSYNSEEFISQTINSIINQTYSNWELLITDDCSNDLSTEIIKSFVKKDNRIKLYTLDYNSGAGVARNNSIKYSNGKYIAFCDSDDQWLPNKLEKQIAFLKENNLQFSYSSYKVCNEEDEIVGSVICPKEVSFRKMLNNNYVGCLTAIYDSEKLGKFYMSKIRNRQDWVLWLNILKNSGPAMGLTEPLAIYRERSSSISSNKIKQFKFNWNVYRKELGYNSIVSTLLIINFLFHYAAKKI
ncbi:glycosyltransferase [Flavobacteriaceae bacterium]|nr:glycosyltransferase [Flavobacteriaceae bacterium]